MSRTGKIGDDARERLLREDRGPVGAVVAGRFRIRERLGAGGGGDVFVADDLERGGAVALKLLADGTTPSRDGAFEREPRLALRLDHPGLARTVALGESDGRAWVVSELVPGETLAARLRRGPLDAGEGAARVLEVLDAIAYLHAAGVAHGDVKPGNVMLAPGGARLLDYGLARRLGLPPASAGEVWGTVEYLAPERFRGETGDHRADLYAVSVLLWESLTGSAPFRSATSARAREGEVPVPPLGIDGPLAGLLAVAVRGMAVDPGLRFPSARAMADAVRAAASGTAGGRALRRALRDDADRVAGREVWGARLGRRALPLALAVAIALLGFAVYWVKMRPLP